MMGNQQPRVSNFQGFDLMTLESDANPLTSSIIGAPYQVRATDPADYGRTAVEYLQNGGPGGVSSTPPNGSNGDGGFWGAITSPNPMDAYRWGKTRGDSVSSSWWDTIKVGATGAFLGVLLVVVGAAYILWGEK